MDRRTSGGFERLQAVGRSSVRRVLQAVTKDKVTRSDTDSSCHDPSTTSSTSSSSHLLSPVATAQEAPVSPADVNDSPASPRRETVTAASTLRDASVLNNNNNRADTDAKCTAKASVRHLAKGIRRSTAELFPQRRTFVHYRRLDDDLNDQHTTGSSSVGSAAQDASLASVGLSLQVSPVTVVRPSEDLCSTSAGLPSEVSSLEKPHFERAKKSFIGRGIKRAFKEMLHVTEPVAQGSKDSVSSPSKDDLVHPSSSSASNDGPVPPVFPSPTKDGPRMKRPLNVFQQRENSRLSKTSKRRCKSKRLAVSEEEFLSLKKKLESQLVFARYCQQKKEFHSE
nr:uncharacterized protein LOC123775234 [Procambarus clarkii]